MTASAFGDRNDGGVGVGTRIVGITEASATRSRSTPRTRNCASTTAAGSVLA
jgi:hypothetical protein